MSHNMDNRVQNAVDSAINSRSLTGNERNRASNDLPRWAWILLVLALISIGSSVFIFRPKAIDEQGIQAVNDYLNSEWSYLYGESMMSKKFVDAPTRQIPLFKTNDRVYYSISFDKGTLDEKHSALEENIIDQTMLISLYDDKENIYLVHEDIDFIRMFNIGRVGSTKDELLKASLLDEVPENASFICKFKMTDRGYVRVD